MRLPGTGAKIPGAIVFGIDSVELGKGLFSIIKPVGRVMLSVYSLVVGFVIMVCRGGGLESDMPSLGQWLLKQQNN